VLPSERKAANQNDVANIPTSLTPADESPSPHGPRECEPGRGYGAWGGVVRHAADRIEQSSPVAANAQGSRLRAADIGAPRPKPPLGRPSPKRRRCRRCLPKPTPRRARNSQKSARPATISRRAQAPRSARRSLGWSGGRSPRSRASHTPIRLKGVGGNWTFEALNVMVSNPKKEAAGTKMTSPARKIRRSEPIFWPTSRPSRTRRSRSQVRPGPRLRGAYNPKASSAQA